jgi:hypothetical protein
MKLNAEMTFKAFDAEVDEVFLAFIFHVNLAA